MKLKGLKEAVSHYNRYNGSGDGYATLMYDVSTGELWADYFASHNEWRRYHSGTIINLGREMTECDIPVTVSAVERYINNNYGRSYIAEHFPDLLPDEPDRRDVPMTNRQRYIAYAEAANYTDVDAYISDMALSDIWGDEDGEEIPQERVDALRRLWEIYHLPVRDLYAPRTMMDAAEELCISYRTLQNWCANGDAERPCAPHLRLWMAELLGYKKQQTDK